MHDPSLRTERTWTAAHPQKELLAPINRDRTKSGCHQDIDETLRSGALATVGTSQQDQAWWLAVGLHMCHQSMV